VFHLAYALQNIVETTFKQDSESDEMESIRLKLLRHQYFSRVHVGIGNGGPADGGNMEYKVHVSDLFWYDLKRAIRQLDGVEEGTATGQGGTEGCASAYRDEEETRDADSTEGVRILIRPATFRQPQLRDELDDDADARSIMSARTASCELSTEEMEKLSLSSTPPPGEPAVASRAHGGHRNPVRRFLRRLFA